MSERGYLVEGEAVRFERRLPGPIERVWEYLVDGEKRGRWLASGPMEPRVGGRVETFFKHSELSEVEEPTPEKYRAMEDGVRSVGTVTRFDPPYALAFTWGEESQPSEVTFELREDGGAVLLTLTHRRLAGTEERNGVAAGWHAHLAILQDELEGKLRRAFWANHISIGAEYTAHPLA